MTTTFKPGDLVQLLSTPKDGPCMTVVDHQPAHTEPLLDDQLIPELVKCAWQDVESCATKMMQFPPVVLRKRPISAAPE